MGFILMDKRKNNQRPYRFGVKASKQVTAKITPNAFLWLKAQGRGWLAGHLEKLAKEKAP